MQQRRVRLGDILDDYCPRERRITNHAVVAMIDDEVKQTRCTTCQSDHEYKGAKTPPPRRRKTGALSGDDAETVIRPRAGVPVRNTAEPADDVELDESTDAFAEPSAEPQPDSVHASAPTEPAESEPASEAEGDAREDRDEWPVHRPLIRATLPRPEGQTPERKAPDFTFRPGGGRIDSPRNGKRHRGHRPARQGQGQGGGQGRFQGPRQSSGQGSSPHGPRHGSGRPRQGSGQGGPSGQRQGPGGGRPAHGRGPRQGSGPGRKRGR